MYVVGRTGVCGGVHGCMWWGTLVYVVGCTGVHGGHTDVHGGHTDVRGGTHGCTWWGAQVYVLYITKCAVTVVCKYTQSICRLLI